MLSVFSTLAGSIAAHPRLAYLAVFVLALSESIPFVGAVVPGTALILGIAALVPSGGVQLWPLLVAAVLGAVLSDGLSYWIGHRYHRAIIERWPLNRYPRVLARSEAFFHRHSGKSVFLARFVPGVRAFIPLMAGMLQMPAPQFYAANVLSALVWAPVHIMPGVFVGAFVHMLGAAAGRLTVLALAVAGLLWGTVLLGRQMLRFGVPALVTQVDRMRRWTSVREGWLAHALLALLDPARSETKVLAGAFGLLGGATWLFLAILEDVANGDPLVQTDRAVHGLFQDLRSTTGDSIMIGITELGDTAVTVPVGVGVFLWLLSRRAWRTAAYWAGAVASASTINTGIKVIVRRARPTAGLYTGWSEFSFPSGHSTVNAVLYGFLVVVARTLAPPRRIPIAVVAAGFVALVSFSRLYLGAHWLSDVVGGLVFAVAWIAVLGMTYIYNRVPPREAQGLLAVACTLLVIAGGANIARRHTADMDRYAVREVIPTVTAADWWGGAWRRFPTQRTSLVGEKEEPLTIQWAGKLPQLEADLRQNGWQSPAPWLSASALEWFTPNPNPMALPVIPQFDRGDPPSLTLIHAGRDGAGATSRIILRLWEADVSLANAELSPLWLGSVVEERLRDHLYLSTLVTICGGVDGPRDLLARAMSNGKLEQRNDRTMPNGWDGQVLLAHAPGLL